MLRHGICSRYNSSAFPTGKRACKTALLDKSLGFTELHRTSIVLSSVYIRNHYLSPFNISFPVFPTVKTHNVSTAVIRHTAFKNISLKIKRRIVFPFFLIHMT